MANNCFPDPKLYPSTNFSHFKQKQKCSYPLFFMATCSKNDYSNPPGRSIYLKFCHNVSKRHKKWVRNFGDSRWKGSRVLASSLMVWAKKPPSPGGNRVKYVCKSQTAVLIKPFLYDHSISDVSAGLNRQRNFVKVKVNTSIFIENIIRIPLKLESTKIVNFYKNPFFN